MTSDVAATEGGHTAREDWINATFVHAIAEVTRRLSRTTPVPRGMPFFGLDMGMHEPLVLDEFCRQGIFRKYERVLILNCGFGGAARWWATRFGCTVIGTDVCPGIARGADVLSRRAGLSGPTTFAAGSDEVPLRTECVTHIWIRDIPDDRDVAPTVRETYRALRPGGHVTAATAAMATIDALREAARREGFIGIETHPVSPVAAPHAFLTALRHLESFVGRMDDETVKPALQSRVASMRRAALERRSSVQFFGQRPS